MAQADDVFWNPTFIELLSAAFTAMSALGILYVMQLVTADAGFSTRLALIKFGHRISLAILAITLFVNAGAILTHFHPPHAIDLFVEAAWLGAIVFSAARHAMAPLKPD